MAKKVSVAYEDPRFSRKEAAYWSQVRNALDAMGAPNSGELLHNSKTYVDGVYRAGLPALDAAAVIWHQHCQRPGSSTVPCVAEDSLVNGEPWVLLEPGIWEWRTMPYPPGGYAIIQLGRKKGFELGRWDSRIGRPSFAALAIYPSLDAAQNAAAMYAALPGGREQPKVPVAKECSCGAAELAAACPPGITGKPYETSDLGAAEAPIVKMVRNEEVLRDSKEEAPEPIEGDRDVYDLMSKEMNGESQEIFVVLCLNLHRQLIAKVEIARGQRDRVVVATDDVLRPVIASNCYGFVVVHNHPSGEAKPSPADRELTNRIVEATRPFTSKFVDHVVVGRGEYFSFADNKLKKVR
jgi:RadC-like JAB domain